MTAAWPQQHCGRDTTTSLQVGVAAMGSHQIGELALLGACIYVGLLGRRVGHCGDDAFGVLRGDIKAHGTPAAAQL